MATDSRDQDTVQQIMAELELPIFYVPGEHDILEDDGALF